MNISSTCMGYNHPDVLAAARSEQMVSLVANRTAGGVHPISEMAELMDKAFFADGVAPAGARHRPKRLRPGPCTSHLQRPPSATCNACPVLHA